MTENAGAVEPGELRTPMLFGRFRTWLAMVAFVVILAGVLFGYDQGVISGALAGMTATFDLSTRMQEVVTSLVTLGALVGALLGGGLADRFGRTRALVIAGVLLRIRSARGVHRPEHGSADGVAVRRGLRGRHRLGRRSSVRRGDVAEADSRPVRVELSARHHHRHPGRRPGGRSAQRHGQWRLMLGLSVVPGVLLIFVAWIMPDSPRWLMKMGRRPDAQKALVKTQGGPKIEERLDVIANDLATNPEAGWSKVFAPAIRRALWVGVGLAVFQQITGINAVIYYSDKIFALAGFTSPEAQTHATLIAVGLVNVLATLIALAWVDKFGRKPLLFAGLIGMTVGLVTIAGAFAFLDRNPTSGGGSSVVGIVTLIAMVIYIASFAFSLGPVVWTMISEIFPSQVRGKAVAVAAAVNWGAAFVVSVTFLSLINAIGEVATFLLFAVMCVLAFVWIRAKVPETKGKSLEQIQEAWAEHDDSRKAPPGATLDVDLA